MLKCIAYDLSRYENQNTKSMKNKTKTFFVSNTLF